MSLRPRPAGEQVGRWTATSVLAAAVWLPLSAASPAADAAFTQFWRAANPADASRTVTGVLKSGVAFDEALERLKRGRPFEATVPKGIIRLTHRLGDRDFPYLLEVPEGYDPARRYQVRMQLHGGVGRPVATQRGNGIGALAGVEQIYVLPTAWSEVEWWTNAQLENLRAILDSVKRTYNVDENRVVLSGVSDGGTGAYYLAMRDTTPFASFLPLNGAMAVLRSPSLRAGGEMFPNNYLNKPFFIVNGGRDPLYPTALVEPYVQRMIKSGVQVTYRPRPEAAHNTAWWPEVKDTYETFVREHPRDPLPARLTWESDLTAGTERAHWLVIDALAKPRAEAPALPDLNDATSTPMPSFGVRAVGTRVTFVAAGSNAESFKLLPGDVILKIDERSIPAGVEVLDLLSVADPKTKMILTVLRDGGAVELPGMFNPVAAPRVVPMFPHIQPSGRVDLIRQGNTVTATTRRVAQFTLLLSPDVFDFAKPIAVVADGKTVFDGRVATSLATLLKWAARDNDRTQLFGAELKVKLAP